MRVSDPLRLRWKLFLLFGSLVALAVIACSALAFRQAERAFSEELDAHLIAHASLVAASIDPDRLETITSEDAQYREHLRSLLMRAQKSARLSWLSVYRKKRDYFVSVVDGHDHLAGVLCYGYPIFDISPAMLSAWEGSSTLSPHETDVYGNWKSAFVPVRNASGTVVGIVDASLNATLRDRLRASVVRQTGLLVAIGLLLSLLVSNRFASLLTRGLDTLVAGIARIGAGDLSFRFHALSGDEIGTVAAKFNEMIQHLQEKISLSRFVSESVQNVVQDGLDSRDPGGRERKVTVLFSDIRSFTSITEVHPPRDVVTMLNGFLEAMTEAIRRHGGVVDKFIGDSIMAVFYPDEREDDELRAVLAGLEMMEELRRFNRRREEAGLFTIQAGIGINTGTVVAGIIGSSQGRIEYTVIGDPVNTASRLEDLSKNGSHTRIIISGQTGRAISHLFDVTSLGTEKVKGKQREVEIFEIVGLRNPEGILKDFHSAPESLRVQAVRLLGLSGRPEMVPPLLDILTDASPQVRLNVIRSLRHFPSEGPRIVAALKGQLSTESDPQLLSALAWALGHVGTDEDRLALLFLLRHEDSRVRADAIDSLGRVSDPTPLLMILPGHLADPDNRARANAAFLLHRLGDPRGLQTLLSMCGDKGAPAMRISGARGLGDIAAGQAGGKRHAGVAGESAAAADSDWVPSARVRLEGLLDDPDPQVFQAAVTALGKIAHPLSLPPVLRILAGLTPQDERYAPALAAVAAMTRAQGLHLA